ncbi:hypothetical protein ADUPG1_007005, partial [Aduncisulcus paluster]
MQHITASTPSTEDDIREDPDSLTLTSKREIKEKCTLGIGGFGQVQLVTIGSDDNYCVLKKIVRRGDKQVLMDC